MDETEIDEWFALERERLEEDFTEALLSTNDDRRIERAKKRFDRDYGKLITTYQDKQRALLLQTQRIIALRVPLARVRAWWHMKKQESKTWFTRQSAVLRKWRFERKIRRILKDKSDL